MTFGCDANSNYRFCVASQLAKAVLQGAEVWIRVERLQSMNKRTVLAMNELPFTADQWKRLLEAVTPDELVRVSKSDEVALAAALGHAEIAFLADDLGDAHLHAPSLKWVHCDHAGLNGSAKPEALKRGLIITGSAGRSGPALAEHAFMFLLALTTELPTMLQTQMRKQWAPPPDAKRLSPLFGKTLAVIGMGHTGNELVPRANAFGMRVIGYRRRAIPVPGVEKMYSVDQGHKVDEVLRRCDAVVVAASLNDTSHHLIGRTEIALLKPEALVVNLARGPLIDEAALCEALHDRRIAGAGLDVFETEPLPPASPLWHAPNTILTPHFTPAAPDRSERSLQIIIENIRRYREGIPLKNAVTNEDVYTAIQQNR